QSIDTAEKPAPLQNNPPNISDPEEEGSSRGSKNDHEKNSRDVSDALHTDRKKDTQGSQSAANPELDLDNRSDSTGAAAVAA
uniref:Pecanex-like protein n=1 Tax=Syphacia muris TaxID=451379 RepID=A0A0N5ABI9_9BILA